MAKKKKHKTAVVFSTGEESLTTLGEELRRKFPELADKFHKLQESDPVVGRLADTVLDLFPYDWTDRTRFRQGLMFCLKGDLLDALGVFSEILESEPEAYPVYHLLGYVCGCMGRYKMEVEYYRKAIKLNPGYPQVHIDLGAAYGLLGKAAKAYAAFKTAVTLAPDFAIADHWLTFASDNLGRHQDAFGIRDKEQEEKAEYLAQTYCMLGRAYLEYGLNAAARNAFKNAVRIQPDYADAYYEMGAVHIKKLRNPGRRDKYLEKAERMYAEQGDAHRAALAHQLRVPRDTVREPEKAAEEWFKEGLRLHKLNLYQNAVDAYRMAVAFRPDFPDAYYNMGIAYGSLQDLGLNTLASAIGAFRHSIRLQPEFIHAYTALGAAYLRQGSFDEATELLERALILDSNEANIYYYLGTAYRMTGNPEKAVPALERAVELAPDYLQVRFNLGLALMETRQYSAAVEAFDEVVRIKPDFADAHYVLGNVLYSHLNTPERAVTHFKKAEKLYTKLKVSDKAERIRNFLERQAAQES